MTTIPVTTHYIYRLRSGAVRTYCGRKHEDARTTRDILEADCVLCLSGIGAQTGREKLAKVQANQALIKKRRGKADKWDEPQQGAH